MRKNLIFAALALAGLATLGFTPTRRDNSYTTNGVTYAQRGGLGSADYVVTNVTLSASDVGALPNSEQGLKDNSNFSNAVVAVSPPVVLPEKWALANVTNASGNAVGAADVGALPDSRALLEANANFSNAVVSVSPPVELPDKWALSNVTNASGGAVAATDVGALAKTDITHDDWSSARGYHKGDIVRKDGRTYRALSNIRPDLAWVDFLWEEVTDVKTAMSGALQRNYLALGELGTNTVGGVETDPEAADYIAITTGDRNNDGIVDSVFWMTPTDFGNKIGKVGNGWRFSDDGQIFFKSASTNFIANILDFFTPSDIRSIESPYTDYAYRTSFVTSPYYVYAYLAGNYETATTAGGKYLQQSVAANTYLTQTDAANTYASIAALAAATGAITRVYGYGGYTNYIDGLRGVYIQPPPATCYTNTAGLVYAPAEENYWRPESGTTYLRYANFRFFYFNGTSEVMGLPVYYGIAFSEDLNFYTYERPSEWQRVGTLALESWVGGAITAATNGFVKAEDIDLSEYATTGSVASVAATVPNNITRSTVDATLVHCDGGTCTNALVYILQATHSLAGLMTAADKTALDGLAASAVTRQTVTNVVNEVKELHYDEVLNVTWETRMVGGEMKLYAVTNANISVLN